ncbi:hypothetical protein PFLmoz3_00567 [Pseudomonas fluorescens]|uniref:Uncharacterized protein n=1 Tax=Pseudomonas fluorescens TaxID=294 RepID=A0A109LLS1_PSEFL|nr:hypothetical protein PFLmoz3_00567 [Pseudomonas fluorescens]
MPSKPPDTGPVIIIAIGWERMNSPRILPRWRTGNHWVM